MSEKSNELIIDPELLAEIQRQCRQRAAELEAAGSLRQPLNAPERPQGDFGVAEVSPPVLAKLTEAERFAVAVSEMPANIRRFFEAEDLVSPRTSRESSEERAERHFMESIGGWCG